MKKAIYSFLFFMVCYFSIAQEFTLKGNALIINSTTYQLTKNAQSQAGLITNLYPLDLTTNFELNFELYFGTNNNNGADGIALLFSNDCNPPLVFGNGLAVAGIPNSLIVEFDTFDNGNGNGSYDIPDDHITIFKNGVLDQANSLTGPAKLPNIEDGRDHKVKITWEYFSPDDQTLTVYFDDKFITYSTQNHIVDSFAGQTNVFYSFGGSTGLFTNEHRVRVNSNSTIYNVCAGDQTTLLAPTLGRNYSWTQGTSTTNSNTFTPTSSGVVSCNYTDNCGVRQTVNFTVNVFPAIVAPTIPAVSTCIGVDSSFTITGTPGLAVDYNINGGIPTRTIIGASGTAIVSVINPQVNQTLTITKVSNASCSNTVNISQTITVGNTSTTTPIIQTN
jgi:hypothetical protein